MIRRVASFCLVNRLGLVIGLVAIFTATPLRADAEPWTLPKLMAALAKHRSGTARFKEERHFRHLTKPIVLTGTLSYRAPDRMEKTVRTPRTERLVIIGDTQLIYSGRSKEPRSALLSSFPALAGTIIAMRATLSGDLATLRKNFAIGMTGTRSNWTVRLLPLTAAVQTRVARIAIHGSDDRPSRFDIHNPDGDRITIHILTP